MIDFHQMIDFPLFSLFNDFLHPMIKSILFMADSRGIWATNRIYVRLAISHIELNFQFSLSFDNKNMIFWKDFHAMSIDF